MNPNRFTKENFLWLPLACMVILDTIYLLFVVFMFFVGITDKNPIAMELVNERPMLFIASTLITRGLGIAIILISNAIGVVIGLFATLFMRRPFSRIWKRRIGFFLIFFYILIFGTFIFLVLRY
ncbi:MAG: hypothetical protein A3F82_04685 [Deltaproteobacteria bacterium RIFCSPLOWO2_12_FULL_44_12]|nr:MAG: hypothetical protein A2712_00440 [Deltaproteobacteria bacterium RIFCSPHIGHO2_01_FULL_43_49]OGQ14257.1 MAG: hypothetical protein A3D22_10175 [Deltaproteobacteria bacterium RIFCSPHIGHO2_02_FULL_44_53]OGQ27473.1 MAG: hypothetical protein A3D98_03775 [Deltaproteobacteria bacterium RIFCSPHIGHO2_12_FULL_44_21]OGQ30721.1 MAG: hypothetical protein A2979_06200 [Deltaproteobacteria bacterium RIFCSPLOWO2_01_FULL_45_74]OGQ42398.1 MAG: hypothetical protein A3I70_02685 [Deltaproteobacteria bacterium 